MAILARVKGRQKGPQRRKTILEATAQAFAERGYHATSMREIATAAGITKPVLYDHFASKEELYVALLKSVRDELTSGSAEEIRQDAAVEERIRAAVDRFFRYVEMRPAAAKVLFTQPEAEPLIVDAWRRVQTEATRRLVELIASERNLMKDQPQRRLQLELRMEFVKKGLHGLALWWILHPRVSRRLVVDSAMTVVWQGLGRQFAMRDRCI